jgi:hypothetical protein
MTSHAQETHPMATRSPDYARADRRIRAYSHVQPSPAVCEGQAWSHALREANAWRKREADALTCTACGFFDASDGFSHASVAHDNLCCGAPTLVPCHFPFDCITHDNLVLVVA